MKKITLLFLVLILVLGMSHAQSVGDDAPPFTVNTVNDNTFSLSENEGKVIFIFFFWVGCPFCQAVAPDTETEIYDVYKENSDFAMLGIEVLGSSKDQTQTFANNYGMTYTIAYDGNDVASSYGTSYDNAVVINKEGKIAYETTGGHGSLESSINDIRELIGDLLDGTTSVDNLSGNQIPLAAYPNPFSDQIEIQYATSNFSEQVHIEVYSISGELINQTNIQPSATNNININTANWQQGLYIIQLHQQNEIHHLKVVKSFD